jgi:uncharacterized Zn finger protein
MKPIGLTFKKDGEIMIVHRCLNCGKISPNRIAGDDNSDSILALLDKQQPVKTKVHLLTPQEKDQVLVALFGHGFTERIV